MPRFRKLSPTEVATLEHFPSDRRVEGMQEYDGYLADFAIGDYGRVELHTGERRGVVRARLRGAARRRNLALRFRPGSGAALIFQVVAPATTTTSVGPPLVGARRDPPPRRQ